MKCGAILLVEDDPDDAHLLMRAFRRAGIASPVLHVRDGDAAVAYLSGTAPFEDRGQHPLPNVVLLDLKLPRRSGHEVLEWVRAQADLRRLPIVVLTSSADRSDVARAYELGANSYLVKPATTGELNQMIRAVHAYWIDLNTPAQMSAAESR